MSKRVVAFLVVFIVGLGFILYQVFVVSQRGTGGLKVDTVPQSSVFLNDRLIGKTPLEEKVSANEYSIKIIPDESAGTYTSWQGSITVKPSLLTYVKRDLGTSELTTGGEIITLEKISGSESQIEVNSTPDGAKILLDGQEKGITPSRINDVSVTEHDVTVTAVGFSARTIRIESHPGYRSSIHFQLALSDAKVTEGEQSTGKESSSSAELTATPSAVVKNTTQSGVVIKDTPTGFLRVRGDASTNSKEVTQVKPGQNFPLLEEKEGWYKIAYEEGKEGWISSRYADKK